MNFRGLVIPISTAMLISIASFIFFVAFAARQQDNQAILSEKAVLQHEIDTFAENLQILAVDNGYWDEAVKNITYEENIDWIKTTLEATVKEIHYIDGMIISRDDMSMIAAYDKQYARLPTITAQSLLANGLADITKTLKITGDPRSSVASGLIEIDGALIAYGVSLVHYGAANISPSKGMSSLLFYSIVSEEELRKTGMNNAIKGVKLSTERTASDSQLALKDHAGSSVGWLSWQSHAPGTRMALNMVVPTSILLIVVLLALGNFLWKAKTVIQALEQASKSKSSFLASVSHELRTPLNAILGFTELLSLEIFGKVEGKKNKEYLDLITESGNHLLSIINDILDITRLEAGNAEVYYEQIDPAKVIKDCVGSLETCIEQKNLTLNEQCETTNLHCDGRIIRQILINIISNSIKFTKPGGLIYISGKKQDGFYQISIADNGIGMTKAQIEVALTTFGQVQDEYARAHSGTGLGLPIVKHFMLLLRGTLDVTSVPGQGTNVTLSFPYNMDEGR